jgi:hypothetical protein
MAPAAATLHIANTGNVSKSTTSTINSMVKVYTYLRDV